MTLILTGDQQKASDAICQFLCNPNEKYFVLKGYSGTGKSTLVEDLIKVQIPRVEKTIHLLNPDMPEYDLVLTATTNKAAESLSYVSGYPVRTIHSVLGLIPFKDYTTGKEYLKLKSHNMDLKLYKSILIVDEASYVDRQLLKFIQQQTVECKVIFIGDPAQLTPVMSTDVPAFKQGYPEATLTEVVRNQGKILELATMFRHAVNTGKFAGFQPDGLEVVHVDKDEFLQRIEQEFNRMGWGCWDSRILTWTNKAAIAYNAHINHILSGSPELKVGDYAINNSYVQKGNIKLNTDETVLITQINPAQEFDTPGNLYSFKNSATQFFMPLNHKDKEKKIAEFIKNGAVLNAQLVDRTWIDLRGAFSSTINKAQGSTYGKVFIDVDDIAKCTSGDQIARMAYVASSRAKKQVVLTGDFG